MSFTLKDIKDAVVENQVQIRGDLSNTLHRAVQDTIDAQSSVRLRFNREKLAEKLFDEFVQRTGGVLDDWEEVIKHGYAYNYWLGKADAIIAADKDIIEVEK